jgi:outer membrane protein OmpA-like peptidoglycan-associated protein
MSEQDQGAEKTALGMVWLLVAVVVASVLAFGVHQGKAHKAGTHQGPKVERIYFAMGDDRLPHEAYESLSRLADVARTHSGVRVVISGFHDATGNASANEALAHNRAEQVRHALEANGVRPAQLVLSPPAIAPSGGDPKEARRVELKLQ